MPLSEHEQRQLEQIEQALYRENPRFGRLVRSIDPRVHYKRKLAQALVGVIIGAGALAAGVITGRVYLEAAGAALLLLSLIWAIISWRRHVATVRRVRGVRTARGRAVPASAAQGRSPRSRGPATARRPGQTRRARLMERMEERWRRRQEGDRRM